ncbi:MAG: HD domain-containing protein [Polyangiaceae bacterium]
MWGDIEADERALGLIDTPEFQRLRGIKQLGTTSLVYPSAVHTRFEHSLGAMHTAARMLAAIEERAGKPFPARIRAATVIASLLHDVTHIPFGHTLEDERRLFPRHDEPERMLRFLRSGALARAIDRTRLRVEVEEILTGSPADPLPADIVRGTFGADLLDYLARDAYFCGLAGRYDARLFRAFGRARDGRLGLALSKDGLLRSDAVSEVLNLLWLRCALSERVYYHHAKVAAGAAISKAVEIGLSLGLAEEDLYVLGDDGLLDMLRRRFARSRPMQAILGRLAARSLYKRAYVLTRAVGEEAQSRLVARFHQDRRAREEAESGLAREVGLRAEDVILYCPQPAMAAKEADAPIVIDGGAARSLSDLRLPEVALLTSKHRDLWRFYIFIAAERRELAPALARAAYERFGHENMLDLTTRVGVSSAAGKGSRRRNTT